MSDTELNLKDKHWKKEIVQVPDWPKKSSVAVIRLTVQHDCLGKHLHRIGLRENPFCMLCGLQKDMDRNHLQRCAALEQQSVKDIGRPEQKCQLCYKLCDTPLTSVTKV